MGDPDRADEPARDAGAAASAVDCFGHGMASFGSLRVYGVDYGVDIALQRRLVKLVIQDQATRQPSAARR